MRSKTDPLLEATQDERVQRLASFVSQRIDAQTAQPGPSAVCVIARSLESPVAKAVAVATADVAIEVPVRALLANVDRKALQGLGRKWEVRVLRSPRMLDAHEQLTVGGASWHGDALRRDASKRDLFEQFNGEAPEALAWSEISFSRMWAAAEPVVTIAPTAADDAALAIAVIASDSQASEPSNDGLQG